MRINPVVESYCAEKFIELGANAGKNALYIDLMIHAKVYAGNPVLQPFWGSLWLCKSAILRICLDSHAVTGATCAWQITRFQAVSIS